MNLTETDLMAAAAAVSAIWMCGVTGVQTQLRGLALQTVALSAICVLVGIQEHVWRYYVLAAVILGVKAVGIPAFLGWAANRIGVRRDTGAYVGPAIGLVIGFAVLVASLLAGRELTDQSVHGGGASGMAIALLFIGMLLMITRRLAISQLIGLLTMENGILLFGLTQTRGMPLIVEMGAVFEILVGVLIGGLVIFRLNRSFEHIDVTDLRRLRR
ncbi:MAG: hypothetical protein ACHQ50_01330 [Fimbriimonadales bacterium]